MKKLFSKKQNPPVAPNADLVPPVSTELAPAPQPVPQENVVIGEEALQEEVAEKGPEVTQENVVIGEEALQEEVAEKGPEVTQEKPLAEEEKISKEEPVLDNYVDLTKEPVVEEEVEQEEEDVEDEQEEIDEIPQVDQHTATLMRFTRDHEARLQYIESLLFRKGLR
jgi:hypothetical protein